jgi:hypothetical protein
MRTKLTRNDVLSKLAEYLQGQVENTEERVNFKKNIAIIRVEYYSIEKLKAFSTETRATLEKRGYQIGVIDNIRDHLSGFNRLLKREEDAKDALVNIGKDRLGFVTGREHQQHQEQAKKPRRGISSGEGQYGKPYEGGDYEGYEGGGYDGEDYDFFDEEHGLYN